MRLISSAVLDYVKEQPWAITQEYLDIINKILYERLLGGRLEIEGEFKREEYKAYTMALAAAGSEPAEAGKARNIFVIPIHGSISKRMNYFHQISGGTSTEQILSDFKAGISDDNIHGIVFDIESPGGTVDGTQALAETIYKSRGKKPIYAHANGLMASAAYWIGSAADEITASTQLAQVGSIGVITAHYDYSEYDKNRGVKRTYLYSGKYKAVGRDNEPLPKEDRNYIQERLDKIYQVFVDNVAQNLGVSSQEVLDNMADGRIFLADEAKERGMVNSIMSLDDTIQRAADQSVKKDEIAATVFNDGGLLQKLLDHQELKSKEKEVSEMENKELLEKNAKLEARVEQLEKENGQLKEDAVKQDALIKEFEAKGKELTEKGAELEAKNKELDKELTIMKANDIAGREEVLVESTTKKILAESKVPESLHEKITAMIDYSDFKGDNEFKEGSQEYGEFVEKFKAEVADWEGKMPKAGDLGFGDTNKEKKELSAENKKVMEEISI
jgi:signal peptide peptidase SppA